MKKNREKMKEKRRDTMKKKREERRENYFSPKKCFKTQTRQMN